MQDIDRMIEDNQKLVYFVLNRYFMYSANDDDCIQSGMIGLGFAAMHYDENKGAFSTYAIRSIHREITKYINRRSSRESRATLCTLDAPAFRQPQHAPLYGVVDTRLDVFEETTEKSCMEDFTEYVDAEESAQQLLQDIESKDKRCATALKYRLDGLTLQEIGDIMGCSRERARQLCKKAARYLPQEYIRGN